MATKSIEVFFEGKPESFAIFHMVADQIAALGPSEISVASQISFGVKRKFAWFWLYNETKTNPNGIPHLMLALDREVRSDHVRHIDHISKNRWNHQIVVPTEKEAGSQWLRDLLEIAYTYGTA